MAEKQIAVCLFVCWCFPPPFLRRTKVKRCRRPSPGRSGLCLRMRGYVTEQQKRPRNHLTCPSLFPCFLISFPHALVKPPPPPLLYPPPSPHLYPPWCSWQKPHPLTSPGRFPPLLRGRLGMSYLSFPWARRGNFRDPPPPKLWMFNLWP